MAVLMSQPENQPSEQRLMEVLEATWPPAEVQEAAGWRLRRGDGGGQRVSAATWTGDGSPSSEAIDAAEAVMRGWGQRPLFQISEQQEVDAILCARGYRIGDPTVLYVAPSEPLTGAEQHIAAAYRATFVPAILEGVWDAGGIGANRRAVMARASGPSVYLMSRVGDRPCAGAFLAIDGDIAMIHAIEVMIRYRRNGAARLLMEAGARFATDHSARWMALAVTQANAGARALYEKMGMVEAGSYHYRVHEND